MKLSPSWEAANCAATQELSSVLWNPKVHYRVHKSPALVPILIQIDPIPSYLSKIHFNIVHPPTWLSHFCYEMTEVRKYIVTDIKHFVNMVQALKYFKYIILFESV
jgi:hypothetical protein